MLKFLARMLGLLLVAAGFVGLVIDGTRSMVNNVISLTSVDSLIGLVVPGGVPGLQTRVAARFSPWLWDSLIVPLLQLPASVTAFLVGAFLLWLGQRSMEPIGYLAGR
ncbi:PetM family of cytochrome b6f complex subunit 7 [Microvirga thermotolerans]|uniref:PetM family of cytochrome b6f complex subunit 7 n=1 Tax=Microvirga thermotolerans TaxID=2651334 RepID=A0A5P9JXN0_9HYPH|nr:PetM family of cytochrome b6f complex subunit 7 [Microvirga thermotolerans]QFU17612.1 PetM family of cytochrome b6f complex subunit 7 [Microvirga thermotolerans]